MVLLDGHVVLLLFYVPNYVHNATVDVTMISLLYIIAI